ncbi:MAG: ABC transporter ATP-binding protein [Pseudomonadota bacterium]
MVREAYNRVENWIDPFAESPVEQPPQKLMAFYWHYVRQVWPTLVAVLVVGLFVALIEVSLLAYLGQLVDLARSSNPQTFFEEHGATLLVMAVMVAVARPLIFAVHTILVNQVMHPNFASKVRWQAHRYVLRQSLSFFQNDFAGRIAQRVMQTPPSLSNSVVQIADVMWFVIIYAVSALVLFGQADWRLVVPMVIWIALFIATLVYFVPRIKERSHIQSEARATVMGRVVDSYTNMLTVKLFGDVDREDAYVRDAIDDHRAKLQNQMRTTSMMEITVYIINGVLIAFTAGLALSLWSAGTITLGAVALVITLILRLNNMAGWVMFVVAGVFQDMGTVQEGITTISRRHDLVDAPDARELAVKRGKIAYEGITFHYGNKVAKGGKGIIDDLSLTIAPGEKVGLVGQSGAGKSTLVNLLLRFYDLEGGRLLIDGQDVAHVSQASLRAQIGLVTQDTSLLHRSVFDNISYGRPDVDLAAVVEAAKKAQAHEFILDLVDQKGRKGYEAHVGERGVKLSGGQRQRIAIARVLLKNAPILVLDEATSALDSEVEAAIQEQFENLMADKTVIAVAHRLSTIAAMDRLVIMDRGAIVEQGSHEALLARGGVYARLWARQSGGFLAHEAAE